MIGTSSELLNMTDLPSSVNNEKSFPANLDQKSSLTPFICKRCSDIFCVVSMFMISCWCRAAALRKPTPPAYLFTSWTVSIKTSFKHIHFMNIHIMFKVFRSLSSSERCVFAFFVSRTTSHHVRVYIKSWNSELIKNANNSNEAKAQQKKATKKRW